MISQLLLLLSFILLPDFADAWPMPSSFTSGEEICQRHVLPGKEFGFRINVPVDYNNPTGEQTSIYAWTKKPFRSELPSLIFINGGPGDTAHGTAFDLDAWNIVFFDQRGNSCSRPKRLDLYLDPSFYSSENTARDINQIRSHLGLSKVSIYGVSYGTVPASIYAHLFEKYTHALVLEGIVFQGGSALISPERTVKILQRYFNQLSPVQKEQILSLSKASPLWFYSLGTHLLYLDNPRQALEHLLNYILALPTSEALAFIDGFLPRPPKEIDFGFDYLVLGMIGCKELGMSSPSISSHFIFEESRLVPSGTNYFFKKYCEPLSLHANTSPYSALNHPTQVPTTYIQGTFDGATSAREAVRHFKTSSAKFKNLILVNEAGHLPIFSTLGAGYEQGLSKELRQQLLDKALRGEPPSIRLLQELGSESNLRWTQTAKPLQ